MNLSNDLESALANGTPFAVLRATIARFQCDAGTIHLLAEGVLKLAAHANIPPPVVEIVQTVAIGKGIAGLAAERLQPISLCNLQTDTTGQARPTAKTTGMEGSIAVPMLAGTTLRGVLGIAKAHAHDWTEAEKTELLAIAARFAERV